MHFSEILPQNCSNFVRLLIEANITVTINCIVHYSTYYF